MTETVNTTVIRVDTNGAEISLRRLQTKVDKLGQTISNLGPSLAASSKRSIDQYATLLEQNVWDPASLTPYLDQLDALDSKSAQVAAAQGNLKELSGFFNPNNNPLVDIMKAANTAAKGATKDAPAKVASEWTAASTKIGDALTKAFVDAFQNGKSVAHSMVESTKKMFYDQMLTPLVKGALSPVTDILTSFVPGALQGSSLSGVAAGSDLISNAMSASSFYSAINGAFTKFGTSVTNGVNTLFSKLDVSQIGGVDMGTISQWAGKAGELGAGLYAGHALGNAIAGKYNVDHGQTITNVASVIGAIIGQGSPIGAMIGGMIGGVINRAFGHGPKEVTSQGIRGTLSSSGVVGENYSNWHQDGGWFRSDKNGTDVSALSADLKKQFTDGFAAIVSASSGFASSLGVSADSISNYSKTFDIVLKDKDAAGNQKKITAFFDSVGNDIAKKLVPNLGEFTKSGESASAALQRLAGDFDATNTMAKLLGKSAAEVFGSLGMASAKAREHLIDLAGGADVLTQEAGFYAQNFMTEAERLKPVREALDAAMDSLGLSGIQTRDQFAEVVESLDLTTDAGAKQFASMMKLAEAFAQVHPATEQTAEQLGELLGDSAVQVFGAFGVESEKARKRLIELAGGASLLSAQTSVYTENFLTEAERLKPVQKELDGSMASLGLSSVQTREQFRDVIESLDLTTEAGAQQFAAMMKLAEAFAQVHPVVDQVAEALQKMKDSAAELYGNVDDAFSVLQKVVAREKSALQSSIDEKSKTVSTLQSISDALHGTLDSMRTPDQKMADRASAQAEIRTALAIAKAGGPLPDADKLKKALDAASQDASGQFSSYTDYLRDLYQTQGDISSLASITDDSLSVEEASLQALNDQLAYLDGVLEAAQLQIEEAKGQSTTLLSIDQAIKALDLSLAQARTNPIIAATSGINKAYQEILGRAPDAAGLEYWQNAAASGQSLEAIKQGISSSAEAQVRNLYKELLGRTADADGLAYWVKTGASVDAIRDAIKQSDEYKLKGLPAYASGGLFGGGLRIVGENGPELEATGPSRIWSSQQTASILGRAADPSANAEALAAAVQRLTETVERQAQLIAQLQDPLTQTELNTRRLATDFQRVTRSGDAMITTTG